MALVSTFETDTRIRGAITQDERIRNTSARITTGISIGLMCAD
jgi:hypothetical protein